MLALQKIAITGGIGSGKSTVCQIFKDLGAFVVSADGIVHDLLTPNTGLGKQVTLLLNLKETTDGKLFRKLVAEKVFKNGNSLSLLESLVHPAVLKKIEELYEQVKLQGKYTCFVVEVPLLFEIQSEKFYDVTIAVLAEDEKAAARFESKGFSKKEYKKRMQRQLEPSQKSFRADYTLLNNGSIEDLKKQVISLYQTLQKH